MNQKPTGLRASYREIYRAYVEAEVGKQSPEQKAQWEQVRAELSKSREEARLPIETPLPDLWNYDSERLLKELGGIREMILRVPVTLETRSAMQSAIDRIWRVEGDVRFLLHLQRDAQREFAKRAEPHEKTANKSIIAVKQERA
jgi:hypothetical protein